MKSPRHTWWTFHTAELVNIFVDCVLLLHTIVVEKILGIWLLSSRDQIGKKWKVKVSSEYNCGCKPQGPGPHTQPSDLGSQTNVATKMANHFVLNFFRHFCFPFGSFIVTWSLVGAKYRWMKSCLWMMIKIADSPHFCKLQTKLAVCFGGAQWPGYYC